MKIENDDITPFLFNGELQPINELGAQAQMSKASDERNRVHSEFDFESEVLVLTFFYECIENGSEVFE